MSLKIWTSKEQVASADLNASFASVLAQSIYNEDLTAFTGANPPTFTPANRYKPGTLRVYVSNGPSGSLIRQKVRTGTGPADGDYDEVLDGNGQGWKFSFISLVPPTLSKLVVDYEKANP